MTNDVEFLLHQMEAKMMDMTTWDRYRQVRETFVFFSRRLKVGFHRNSCLDS